METCCFFGKQTQTPLFSSTNQWEKKHTYAPDRPSRWPRNSMENASSATWIQIHCEKVINSHGENWVQTQRMPCRKSILSWIWLSHRTYKSYNYPILFHIIPNSELHIWSKTVWCTENCTNPPVLYPAMRHLLGAKKYQETNNNWEGYPDVKVFYLDKPG